MSKQLICSQCGHVGNSKIAIKGNGAIEIVLWLCFIIPGIIYSIWRSSSRHKVCQSCGSNILIPLDSPVGRKLLTDQGKTPEEIERYSIAPKMSLEKKIIIGIVGFVVLVFIIGIMSIFNSVG